MTQMLIVNADDFGLSHAVNAAIKDAFAAHLISSTTFMANMPGFEEAGAMIQSGEVPRNCIGIHLNLFEGVPLTDGMKRNLLYCNEDGVFRYTSGHISFGAPKVIANTIVRAELEAQIQKILATGLIPTHLDSHAHYHSNWYVGKVVIDLAKKYHIPYVRTSPNLSCSNWKKKLLNMIFDRRKRLERNQLKKCDFMGNIPEVKAFFDAAKNNGYSVEMMCHPVYTASGILEDAEFHAPLSELLSFFKDTPLTSYAD